MSTSIHNQFRFSYIFLNQIQKQDHILKESRGTQFGIGCISLERKERVRPGVPLACVAAGPRTRLNYLWKVVEDLEPLQGSARQGSPMTTVEFPPIDCNESHGILQNS